MEILIFDLLIKLLTFSYFHFLRFILLLIEWILIELKHLFLIILITQFKCSKLLFGILVQIHSLMSNNPNLI
jgi:hypothetical protein